MFLLFLSVISNCWRSRTNFVIEMIHGCPTFKWVRCSLSTEQLISVKYMMGFHASHCLPLLNYWLVYFMNRIVQMSNRNGRHFLCGGDVCQPLSHNHLSCTSKCISCLFSSRMISSQIFVRDTCLKHTSVMKVNYSSYTNLMI